MSLNEWIMKMWCICTVEFYSMIKKNEIMKFAGKSMELETVTLSEATQTQKNNVCFPSFVDLNTKSLYVSIYPDATTRVRKMGKKKQGRRQR